MTPIKTSFQSKLFYYFLIIMAITMICGGVITEENLVDNRMKSIQTEMLHHLHMIELFTRETYVDNLPGHYDIIAKKMGGILRMRVTYIDAHGVVVGDSMVKHNQISFIENHASRPEVLNALTHNVGISTRYSSTISKEMFYIAYCMNLETGKMIVRLARPLQDLHDEIFELRMMIAGSLLISFAISFIMSGIASFLTTKSLRALVKQTTNIVNNGLNQRLVVASQDEIGSLATSFNTVFQHLEQLIAQIGLEQERLKTVLDGIIDGVIGVDGYGRIHIANHTAMTLLDLKVTPVLRYLEEILPTDQFDGLLPPYLGIPCQKEIILQGQSSKQLLVLTSYTKKDNGCIILLRDITEKNKLRQIQKDFVASASHELRTPVSVIRLNAETLMDGALEDPQLSISLVDAIYRHSLRLSQLVSDLLDLSRLESGDHQLKLSMVRVVAVADRVVDSLLQLLEMHQISLISQIDSTAEVYANVSSLEQILTNLVSNAIKYTPAGGQVVLSAAKFKEEWVRFQVEDNGQGIPLEHHAFLFNRFYRVDPGRSREMGGTGLGLAIVKHAVEAMNGKVGLEPVDPHGCCFWFILPARPVDS